MLQVLRAQPPLPPPAQPPLPPCASSTAALGAGDVDDGVVDDDGGVGVDADDDAAVAMPAAETAAVAVEPDPAAPAPPWVLGRGRATLPCYSRNCIFQVVWLQRPLPLPYPPVDKKNAQRVLLRAHRGAELHWFQNGHPVKTVTAWHGAMLARRE